MNKTDPDDEYGYEETFARGTLEIIMEEARASSLNTRREHLFWKLRHWHIPCQIAKWLSRHWPERWLPTLDEAWWAALI